MRSFLSFLSEHPQEQIVIEFVLRFVGFVVNKGFATSQSPSGSWYPWIMEITRQLITDHGLPWARRLKAQRGPDRESECEVFQSQLRV
jgi:hypothetical protein